MIIDTYECFGCGPDVPRCRISIPHTDDKLPEHLKGRDKFAKRVCICDNQPDILADWRKMVPQDQST
ncbi:hypothetical protein [Pseudosulfitobacter pseudonitzschiae]|uniref:hypothetical protein n=1 Tax=Pseudosulfitobacter pseudonitzschiae TaxID=1402135 RepID=UPI003B7B13F4